MLLSRQRSLFLEAVELSGPARAIYLADACGDDTPMRLAIEELLQAHDKPEHILDTPPEGCSDVRSGIDQAFDEWEHRVRQPEKVIRNSETHDQIDNYCLLELLGEGSFGQVYVAQQEHPIRRLVALKVLRVGLNSQEVIGRFEAERQALARMDHPNIAKVFDAGTTHTGVPYIAMELVVGVPIAVHFAQPGLDLRAKLEIFADVCQAVQHAHQRGVIHRDLKPSNILIGTSSGTPIPKIIDFGVAKAIGEPLTDKAIRTGLAQMVGTPMYMSPEQAELGPADADTRTDVFSLGMVLYELLTGAPPYDSTRLNCATFDELRQIIREEELPRPSVRCESLGSDRVSNKRRRMNAATATILRADLDWIVMKAVAKDPAHRYEGANALGADIRRYLNDEPIEARPPSSWYILDKLIRRHRVKIVAALLIVLSMAVGTIISIRLALHAVAERDIKDQALQDARRARVELQEFNGRIKDANLLMSSARAHADAGRWSSAWLDAGRAVDIHPQYYQVWVEHGALNGRLGLWRSAADDYVTALRLDAPVFGADWWGVPQLLAYAGEPQAAHLACQKMIDQSIEQTGTPSIAVVRSVIIVPSSLEADESLLSRSVEALDQYLAQLRTQRAQSVVNSTPKGAVAAQTGRPDRRPAPSGRTAREKRETSMHAGIDSLSRPQPPEPPMGRGGPPRKPSPIRTPPRSKGIPFGMALCLSGLAHLRAGDAAGSVRLLEESLTLEGGLAEQALKLPVMAMALYGDGQHEKAADYLRRSKATAAEWTELLVDSPIGEQPFKWQDWIEVQLLAREASQLIANEALPEDPRLQSRADRVHNTVQERESGVSEKTP